MNYKIVNTCLILFALSAMTIAGIYAYKTFYYDPKNEWKLISDVKNHVYIVKNRGEDICHYSSDAITNYGTVNTISMTRPFTGKNGPEPMVNLKKGETPEPGIWNFMGKYNLDHKNFIGFFLDSQKMIDDMYSRFEYHASLLYSLP